MCGTTQTCEYSFDPKQWADGREYDPIVEDGLLTDGRWECDRPTAAGETRCIFHRPADEKDGEAVCRRFVEELSTKPAETSVDAVADNRFIGAVFRDFDFSNRVIRLDNNVPIDLRFARVEGDLQCDQFVVENTFRFEGSVVEGEADFRRCRADSIVDVSGCVFARGADFSDSRFEDHVWGIETRFRDKTIFDRTDVRGDLCLAGAEVGDDLRIAGSRIESVVCLSRMECEGGLLFDANDVGKDVWCVGTTVRSNTDSGNLLSKNEIANDLRIRQSTFAGKLSLEKTTVGSELRVETTTVESRWLDLTNCDVRAGVLKQPETSRVMYDFTEATMGNIELDADSGNRFEFCRFENTAFERFDFGRHRSLLHRSDWTIHTVGDDGSGRELRDHLENLYAKLVWLKDSVTSTESTKLRQHVINETTYLKAKNGANRMGDNKAAAEFFIKEMGFRRRRHAETALNGRETDEEGYLTRLKAAGAWVANVGLSATTGYGEKPHRVLLSAGAIIAVFAAFYGSVPGDHYVSSVGSQEAMLLSFQSFVTFILGEAPVGDSFLLRLASTLEGFIGAFLVALSVFALTRSIHR